MALFQYGIQFLWLVQDLTSSTVCEVVTAVTCTCTLYFTKQAQGLESTALKERRLRVSKVTDGLRSLVITNNQTEVNISNFTCSYGQSINEERLWSIDICLMKQVYVATCEKHSPLIVPNSKYKQLTFILGSENYCCNCSSMWLLAKKPVKHAESLLVESCARTRRVEVESAQMNYVTVDADDIVAVIASRGFRIFSDFPRFALMPSNCL